MSRPIVYGFEQIRDYDWLSGHRDMVKANARLAQSLFGVSRTIVTKLEASASTSPDMHVHVNAGCIFQWAPTDENPYGMLDPDDEYIYHLGYADAQIFTITKGGLSSGQEQWVLIQARYKENDRVRPGDPDNGIPPFWNAADPTDPLFGQADEGGILPTMRESLALVQVEYGAPAAIGNAVPPQPGAGFVPLYLILINNSTTAITNGMILRAGNAAYTGYPEAPFCGGLLGRHHLGPEFGQSERIDVTREIDGVVPFGNLPSVSANGLLANIRHGAELPNGNKAGAVDDLYWQTGANVMWHCDTAGDATHAAWSPGGPLAPLVIDTFPATLTVHNGTVLLLLSSGDADVFLPDGVIASDLTLKRIDTTEYICNVKPKVSSGQLIERLTVMPLLASNSARLQSATISGSTNWHSL